MTNGRSVAEDMPLLSGFTSYADCGAGERRWAMMLYSRPVSMGVYYFFNNLKDSKTSVIDKNSGGFPKHKLKAKVGENRKAIIKWELRPGGYEWAFNVLWVNPESRNGRP